MVATSLGTTTGVYQLHDDAPALLGLARERISALHAWHNSGGIALLAGSYDHGLFRSADGGATWERVTAGLTADTFRCLAPDPLQPGALLAGTEPARLFRSMDEGRTWRELTGITQIAGHERWYLPYSPRAGAVRNVYAPPRRPGRILASVEVGGLLQSDDGGATWACRPVLADDDIHYVTGHPQEPDLLYAALGYASLARGGREQAVPPLGGVARSRDGGRTWQKVATDYTRAVLIPPARPDLVLAGPAPHVGREGRIVVSAAGGDTWRPADAGLATPMPDMVELFVGAPDGTIWAICSGGRLLQAVPGAWHWHPVIPEWAGLRVQALAFVPRAG